MRTDKNFADQSVIASTEWKRSGVDRSLAPEIDLRLQDGDEMVGGTLKVHSLSGHERNHLFLNDGAGKHFSDISAVSGADTPSDSRGFALFDYDRDGWQDMAVVNANQPLNHLFHNELSQAGLKGGIVAVRFVGGSTTASPSKFASRDGYGAKVLVDLGGGKKLLREHRCGEGYATQNSATLLIGIGETPTVPSVTVIWPSGQRDTMENVAEGTLLTAHENRPSGAFTQEPYRVEMPPRPLVEAEQSTFPLATGSEGDGLRVYTTTATWCGSCLVHLPELKHLQDAGFELFGVPVDPEDTTEKLAAYVEKWKPAYSMATVDEAKQAEVNAFLSKYLKTQNPPLPSTVITDGKGRVLDVVRGVPTLSALRKLARTL